MIFIDAKPRSGASKQWNIYDDNKVELLGDVTIVENSTWLLLNGNMIEFNVKAGYNLLDVIDEYAKGIDVSNKLESSESRIAHRRKVE